VSAKRLRGKKEEHVAFLLRWFTRLDGAGLSASSSSVTELGAAQQRPPGPDTVEVRMREGGRLLALIECNGRAAELRWSRPTHAGLARSAIAKLYETLGGRV